MNLDLTRHYSHGLTWSCLLQDSVYGANHNEPGFGKKAAATGKKRAAPEDDPALQEALKEHDYAVSCCPTTMTFDCLETSVWHEGGYLKPQVLAGCHRDVAWADA